MKQTSINFNLDALDELMRGIGGDFVARVGILEDKATKPRDDEELTNGEIGMIHEFGSETNNIPARSFLRLPIETKEKEIVKSMGGKTVMAAIEAGRMKTVYSLLGVIAESFVKLSFASSGFGQWEALKQQTINAKGSSVPLIDSEQLRNSVTSDVVKKGDLNG